MRFLAALSCGALLAAGASAADLELPAGTSSPALAVAGDRVLLAHFERRDSVRRALVVRAVEPPGPAVTVIESDSFVVNWADTPVLVAHGRLLALSYPWQNGGEHAYDARLVLSTDGGATWGRPIALHDDGTLTEHGFVSMLPDADGVRVHWLDGRHTGGGHGGGEGEGGPMTLRSARVGWNGAISEPRELDDRVCDCCPTAATATARGAIVAYRDRSIEERRDVSTIVFAGDRPTASAPFHLDGWTIQGCPVNGPALAARGDEVAAAWFSGAADSARVRAAFSRDGGRTFGPAIRVDGGAPLGRTAVVALGDGSAQLMWLESRGDSTDVRLQRIGRKATAARTLDTTGGGREAGMPRLVAARSGLWAAWTRGPRSSPSVVARRVGPARP